MCPVSREFMSVLELPWILLGTAAWQLCHWCPSLCLDAELPPPTQATVNPTVVILQKGGGRPAFASLTNISSQLVLPSPECLSCLQMSCLWMSYLHWDLVLDMIALNNLCKLPACLLSLSCWPTWDPTNFVKSSIHWLHVDLQLLIISKLSLWELETSAHLLFTLTSTEMRDWPNNNKVVIEISDLRTFSKQVKWGNPT
jgi:hypothetical protein